MKTRCFSLTPDLDDHEWRKQFFGDMPHYLSRYFAERYNKIFKQKGRSAANLYLLKTVGKDINPRLHFSCFGHDDGHADIAQALPRKDLNDHLWIDNVKVVTLFVTK
ncbi:hypothetical protein [Moritella sp. 28]|uniref:hypothetical protein n=1 Tax=Moritella sp. 28 TaxID=2746232 RepID=UPI001BA9C7C2|nr:hypothetical protein [Moritella sp. 28]QUM85312.1 hypothetical protein HWV02_12770 [Moritella sp. 28]